MKIPKRKTRAGRVAIAVIVPWYADLNDGDAQIFCMFVNSAFPEDMCAMCIDGIIAFEKKYHGQAVRIVKEFADKIDMDAIRETFKLMLEEGILYLNKDTNRIMIREDLLQGELEEIEVDEDCFLKKPKNLGE